MKTLLCLLLIIAAAQIAFADQEGPPSSYTAETADKKHIFVMLTPFDADRGLIEKGVTYHTSGMYLNDGSTTPLWSVDWQASVYLPAGGRYVVRRGPWARTSGTYQEEVFSFIDSGRVTKTYQTKDLVDFPWLLLHSASHYEVVPGCRRSGVDTGGVVVKIASGEYPNNDGVTFDDARQTMSVALHTGDRFEFDLKTGNVIAAAHPARVIALGLFGVLILIYLIFRFWAARRSRRLRLLTLSNVIVGELFSLSLIFLPAVAVGYTRVPGHCTEWMPALFERMWISFFLLPIYCTKLITNAVPMPDREIVLAISSPELQAWSIAFWVSCVLLVTVADRCFAGVLSKLFARNR